MNALRPLLMLTMVPLVLALVSTAQACPGCQNPNLPMARSTGVYLAPGALRLGAALGATALEVIHEAGCRDLNNCQEAFAQPLHQHEQIIAPMQVQGSLEWGMTDTFALEAQVPVRAVYTTIDYSRDGQAYLPLDAGIHHRNELLVGLGDPLIGVRGTWIVQNWWLVGRVGVRAPVGRTEPDPFAAGDAGQEHQHIQFGTGTWSPLLGAELARSFGRWQVAFYGQHQFSLYENEHGFEAGERSLVGVQGGHRIGERFVLQGSLEGLREGPERWGGIIQQDGLLGRQEVLLGAQAVFSLGGPQYSFGVRVPLWREIFLGAEQEQGEITSPIAAQFGIQWSLD